MSNHSVIIRIDGAEHLFEDQAAITFARDREVAAFKAVSRTLRHDSVSVEDDMDRANVHLANIDSLDAGAAEMHKLQENELIELLHELQLAAESL